MEEGNSQKGPRISFPRPPLTGIPFLPSIFLLLPASPALGTGALKIDHGAARGRADGRRRFGGRPGGSRGRRDPGFAGASARGPLFPLSEALGRGEKKSSGRKGGPLPRVALALVPILSVRFLSIRRPFWFSQLASVLREKCARLERELRAAAFNGGVAGMGVGAAAGSAVR